MDQRLQRNETTCWRAFKTFDKDPLVSLSPPLSTSELLRLRDRGLVGLSPEDGDGKITYSELQQVLEDDELLTEVPGWCFLCASYSRVPRKGPTSREPNLSDAAGSGLRGCPLLLRQNGPLTRDP